MNNDSGNPHLLSPYHHGQIPSDLSINQNSSGQPSNLALIQTPTSTQPNQHQQYVPVLQLISEQGNNILAVNVHNESNSSYRNIEQSSNNNGSIMTVNYFNLNFFLYII